MNGEIILKYLKQYKNILSRKMWRGKNVIKFNTKNGDVAKFYKPFLRVSQRILSLR